MSEMSEKLVYIDSGDAVYGSDSKKIGTVKECTDRYCHVDTGFLGMGPDYYIPIGAIREVQDGDVFLRYSSDQMSTMGWNGRPSDEEMGVPTREFRQHMGGIGMREAVEEMPAAREEMPVTTGEGTRTIPLREEELEVHRHMEPSGEVEVTKRVVEEERTIEVPVTHEEAVVRQRAVDRPAEHPIEEAEGETIRIPLTEERIETEKESRVYSEVEVEKRKVTEPERVTETLRKEVPEIHKKGDVGQSGEIESDLSEAELRERRIRKDEEEAA